ncbi:MAG: T9SS type A sorting domain-containing protein, partial [Ignavibacteriaceae bacterium]
TLSTLTEVYIARSSDGGESFFNFKISESPFETTLQEFLGDYINIVAYNNKIYPVWTRSDLFGRNIMMAVIDNTTEVEDVDQPASFRLYQNYPNPFNPTTKITYSIPQRSLVLLKVYDVLGNEVATLVDEVKPVGEYEIEFEASELTSGIYLYRLEAPNYVESHKMVLIK